MSKQVNKKTGETRVVTKVLRAVDFEFEAEALADFAYQLGPESNKAAKEEALLNNLDSVRYKGPLEMCMPQ